MKIFGTPIAIERMKATGASRCFHPPPLAIGAFARTPPFFRILTLTFQKVFLVGSLASDPA
jgi:hypothetical protein